MPFPRGLLPKAQRSLHAPFGLVPFLGGPAPANVGVVPAKLSMLGNSDFGCCVTSEAFSRMQMYSVMVGLPEIAVSDADCIAWARKRGLLNGADLSDVSNQVARDGTLGGGVLYRQGPSQTVDWTNFDVLRAAIAQGPVQIAISANAIEHAGAGNRSGWVLSGAGRDLATDHCVGLWGASTAQWLADLMHNTLGISIDLGSLGPQTPSVYMYSWASEGIVEHRSLVNITDEAYLRGPTTLPDLAPVTPPLPPPGPTPSPSDGSYIFIDPATKTYSFPSDWLAIPSR
jgi:hypothetical protein